MELISPFLTCSLEVNFKNLSLSRCPPITTTLSTRIFYYSGYVTQYGDGIITSSPSSTKAWNRLKRECFAPLFVCIISVVYSKELSLFSLSTIAFNSSGIPGTAVYLVLPSSNAFFASSFIFWGVSKSGSPAENDRTSFPELYSNAKVVIAIVIGSRLLFYCFSGGGHFKIPKLYNVLLNKKVL